MALGPAEPRFSCDYLGQERPGSTPRLFAPGIVSTGREHSSALFSPDGRWTRPQKLGPRINSPAKDEYPYVTPDGRYLFFNSNRVSAINDRVIPDGPGNIFWVDAGIIEELRPTAIVER